MGSFYRFSVFIIISTSFFFLHNVHAQEYIQIPTATSAYQLSYTLEGVGITFQITAETTGWIGFGFTNMSGMVAADIFIGGVDADGVPYFGDYHSASVGTPRRDTEENWELLQASETETSTYIQFRREFDTTDPGDINITNSLMSIIWALGETDTLTYHGFSRSSLKFNLITGSDEGNEPEPPPTPPTTTTTTTTTTPTPPIPIEIPFGSDLIHATYTISADDVITFVVTAKTTGFVGFGFSNQTGMRDSDMIVGGVNDDDNTPYFEDYFSRTSGRPSLDPAQDWTLISAGQTVDETRLTFSRPLITSDFENDVHIEDKDMQVIWALGSSDALTYHGAAGRGSTIFNLIPSTDSSTEPDIETTTQETPESPETTPQEPETTPQEPTTTTTEVSPGNGEIPLGTDLLKITYSILDDRIIFVATSQTKGYIGFGFSNSSGMFPADIFIGGVAENGDIYFGDYKSTNYIPPARDPQQDWSVLYGHEIDNETLLVFSRLLNTQDLEDDIVIEDKEMTLIWALGSSDDLVRHSNRGTVNYNLIGGQAPTPTTTTMPPSTTNDPISSTTPQPETTTTEVSPGNGEIPLGTDLLKITYSILGETVMFVATAQSKGYVGFGFSNSTSGGMFPADIFIAGVMESGELYFGDYKSTNYIPPARDPQQDWSLIYGHEIGDETLLVFSRLLDTLDTEDDVVIEDKTMSIIWALGSSDDLVHHANRGTASYNLIAGQSPPPTPPPTGPTEPTSTTTADPPGEGDIPMGTNLIRVSFTRAENVITFTAVAKTTGWVGFGFSNSTEPGAGMFDADIFIGGVDGARTYGKDYVSRATVTPEEDTTQNWELISASESNGETTITFSRLLDTGDLSEDIQIENKDMKIIWALGPSDAIEYHGANKGSTEYNLIQTPPTLPPMDPLEKSIPFRTELINVTYAIADGNITFQIIGNTRGFIGFGINNGTGPDAGGMNSSDIFIAWVNSDGSVGFVDTFSMAEDTPLNDTESNWELLSGEEVGSLTRIVFRRRLITSDTEFDIPIENKYLRVIWAMGYEDFITYHGESERGRVNSFNFMTGSEEGSSGEAVKSWMLLNIIMILTCVIAKSYL